MRCVEEGGKEIYIFIFYFVIRAHFGQIWIHLFLSFYLSLFVRLFNLLVLFVYACVGPIDMVDSGIRIRMPDR
jgi:hypothetical protein